MTNEILLKIIRAQSIRKMKGLTMIDSVNNIRAHKREMETLIHVKQERERVRTFTREIDAEKRIEMPNHKKGN